MAVAWSAPTTFGTVTCGSARRPRPRPGRSSPTRRTRPALMPIDGARLDVVAEVVDDRQVDESDVPERRRRVVDRRADHVGDGGVLVADGDRDRRTLVGLEPAARVLREHDTRGSRVVGDDAVDFEPGLLQRGRRGEHVAVHDVGNLDRLRARRARRRRTRRRRRARAAQRSRPVRVALPAPLVRSRRRERT